jgi:hypothetical protein
MLKKNPGVHPRKALARRFALKSQLTRFVYLMDAIKYSALIYFSVYFYLRKLM